MRAVMKVNAKLSLRLSKHHAKAAYGESSAIAPYILHLGNVVSSTLRRLYSKKRDGTHCVGDWVSPKEELREKCVPMPGIARSFIGGTNRITTLH